MPDSTRKGRDLPAGANRLDLIEPDSPAKEAGLEAGDIVLGPPGQPFESTGQIREWTMTSPSGIPLALSVLRPGETTEEDQEFEATLTLRPFPVELPTRAIRLLTEPGEIVLDCFLGSGTSAVAAIRQKRCYIGIEREPKYVKIARRACERAIQPKQMALPG